MPRPGRRRPRGGFRPAPVLVAHDPPVGRVRRVPGHPRDLEAPASSPTRCGRRDSRGRPADRRRLDPTVPSAGSRRERCPSTSRCPRSTASSGCAAAYARTMVRTRAGVRLGQIAAQHLQAARGRMDMGVLEPRQEHPAPEVHDVRPRPDQLPDVGVGPDRDDPSLRDRDRARPSPGGVHRVDTAVDEREARGSVRLHTWSLSRTVLRKRSAQSIASVPRTMLRRPWRPDDGGARARWVSRWRWGRSRCGRASPRGRQRPNRWISP